MIEYTDHTIDDDDKAGAGGKTGACVTEQLAFCLLSIPQNLE